MPSKIIESTHAFKAETNKDKPNNFIFFFTDSESKFLFYFLKKFYDNCDVRGG